MSGNNNMGVQTGIVVRILRDKGFGFIRSDDTGIEYFFHRSGVEPRDTGFDALPLQGKVQFVTEASERGPRACGVRRI